MSVYAEALDFRSRFPLTIAWRLKQNADVIQMHLNEDEKVVYVFDDAADGGVVGECSNLLL